MDNTEFDKLYTGACDTSWVTRKRLDVAYGPHERHRYDVYYPAGEAPEGGWPCVVFYHGGAFLKGDKARYQLRPALTGVRRGYVVVSVQYRLALADPAPAMFADARDALRHLASHADELGIDAHRIVLWGESAGAELAVFTGLVGECAFVDGEGADPVPPVCGVVDWYAPLDLLAWQRELAAPGAGAMRGPDGSTLIELIGGERGEGLVAKAALLDPNNYLHEGMCPVLIEHGDADTLVSPRQSLDFRDNLLRWMPEENVPFRMVAGGEHGIAGYEDDENLEWVFSFIGRCVA